MRPAGPPGHAPPPPPLLLARPGWLQQGVTGWRLPAPLHAPPLLQSCTAAAAADRASRSRAALSCAAAEREPPCRCPALPRCLSQQLRRRARRGGRPGCGRAAPPCLQPRRRPSQPPAAAGGAASLRTPPPEGAWWAPAPCTTWRRVCVFVCVRVRARARACVCVSVSVRRFARCHNKGRSALWWGGSKAFRGEAGPDTARPSSPPLCSMQRVPAENPAWQAQLDTGASGSLLFVGHEVVARHPHQLLPLHRPRLPPPLLGNCDRGLGWVGGQGLG
jgi:hypothetical protein